MLLGKMTDN